MDRRKYTRATKNTRYTKVPQTWRLQEELLQEFKEEVAKYDIKESAVIEELLKLYLSIKGE